MSYYKFKPSDVIFNQIEAHPKCEFFIYNNQIFYNQKVNAPVLGVNPGDISLYEMNVNRSSGLIYPVTIKGSDKQAPKTVSTTDYATLYANGDEITGSYPLSASISFYHITSLCPDTNRYLAGLKNTLNRNAIYSPHYAYSSSYGDKATQQACLITVPSIFYGSSIEKGSVKLDFYYSGSLIGTVEDQNRNGELIQTYGTNGTGNVAGVVLYGEGFILLTGSWEIAPSASANYQYCPGIGNDSARWYWFGANHPGGIPIMPPAMGAGPPGGIPIMTASFNMKFNGTEYVPVTTMFCHAPRKELNFSNNPTYIEYGQEKTAVTGSGGYSEKSLDIKNTVSSSFAGVSASFQKQTFISRIAIYDEEMNVIGYANLANPVKKLSERDYTFKLKVDM